MLPFILCTVKPTMKRQTVRRNLNLCVAPPFITAPVLTDGDCREMMQTGGCCCPLLLHTHCTGTSLDESNHQQRCCGFGHIIHVVLYNKQNNPRPHPEVQDDNSCLFIQQVQLKGINSVTSECSDRSFAHVLVELGDCLK